MSAYKYYDRLEELVDTEKYHAEKQVALDDLFRQRHEGDIRVRDDGHLEVYTKGKWIGP